MAELRLIGVSEDGERLVLADDGGGEHTIVIDERLRAGVHGHLSRLGQLTMALESRISPREIQNRVRAGESAEHVAQTAGVPLERVLRFVGPVLREREHVADQARRARLAGTNGPTSLLGDLVARATNRRGIEADQVTWDSARREDHTWVVTAAWSDGTSAMWALDLLRHQATPLDAAARRVSGLLDEANSDAGDVSARDLTGFPDFADSPEFARFDADEAHSDAVVSTGSAAGGQAAGGHGDAKVHRFIPRAVPNLVEEPADGTAPPDRATDDTAAAEDPAPAVGDVAKPAETTESAETKPAPQAGRSARRAKVPKWDDIMFGMKPKDGS